MRSLALILFILLLMNVPASAEPSGKDDPLVQSMALAEAKKYEDALDVLHHAEAREPDNADYKIAEARIQSWSGHYDIADALLAPFLAEVPPNPDAQIVAAYIDYYRGRLDPAETMFAAVAKDHPEDTEAVEGLKIVQDAQKEAAGFTWAFDAGYEHSSFARLTQPNWSNEFAQVTRFFDHGNTAVHGRFEYYDQFLTTDVYYELGVDHIFTPFLNSYLYVGHTVDPSFRPTWRVITGGNLRLNEPAEGLPVLWLTLDVREDLYTQLAFDNVNPGARLEYEGWSLSPNLVGVHQEASDAVFGWNIRLDTPTWKSFHLYGGYSDAPDTENEVTVYTATAYGGVTFDLTDAVTLRAAYTHDDRENSYIRHVIDASATVRY